MLPGGPVASQEAIKQLGTNGGGFFNANSAHPFENPTAWTNVLEILLLPRDPVLHHPHVRQDGRRQPPGLRHARRRWATLFVAAGRRRDHLAGGLGSGTAPQLAGGRDGRQGGSGSASLGSHPVRRRRRTLTSTGAVNSMHDTLHAAGRRDGDDQHDARRGRPGGVGAGLYGMLVLAIIAVFVAGLMVGRTPEYLGKKIGPREIKLASLYILTTPTLVLLGTALSFAIPAFAAGRRVDLDLEPGRCTASARCCTPSRPPRTTTARPSPASRRTPPGSTRRWASRCCSAASCRSCSCSRSPARFAAQDKVPEHGGHPAHPPAPVRRPAHRHDPRS